MWNRRVVSSFLALYIVSDDDDEGEEKEGDDSEIHRDSVCVCIHFHVFMQRVSKVTPIPC